MLKILIYCALFSCCVTAEPIETIDLHEFNSFINGKIIITRISPDFVKRGGHWSLGSPIRFDLSKLISNALAKLKKGTPKKWVFRHTTVQSYDSKNDEWYLALMFGNDEGDIAVILCNMNGEVWKIGKKYDEFD